MVTMRWKTKQILMVLFGGIVILTLIAAFLAEDIILVIINAGIGLISFIVAILIKELIPIKRRRIKRDKSISR
jgi:predicted lysophospholipase L1 biosynthesis ABC-type transport system permease subunit